MAVVARHSIVFAASTYCCLLMFLPTVSGQSIDQTRVSQATGPEVVDAVVDLIEQSCIFDDDFLMLRRIASAETQDGRDPRTFSQSTNSTASYGGIWQVSEESFMLTKFSADSTVYSQIKSTFNIDWTTVSYKDLWKPLYSGLAARLKIDSYYRVLGEPEPVDVDSQARYWAQYYTVNSWGSLNDAVNVYKRASSRTVYTCRSPKSDVVFVLGSSKSIGTANFVNLRQFVVDVVQSFVIGNDNVRVSVIQFGNDARIEFDLTSYNTKAQLVSAINNIPYLREMTNMAAGLHALESVIKSSPRNDAAVVAVVLSDGESNTPTPAAAARAVQHLHQTFDDKLTIYSIGVGKDVDRDELKEIASKPSCQNLFLLSSFRDITAFSYQLMQTICHASAKLSTTEQVSQVSGVLSAGETYYFELRAFKHKNGIAIEVKTSYYGVLEVYLSRTVHNPSPILHDYSFIVNRKRSVKVLIPWPGNGSVDSRPSNDTVSGNALTSTVTLYGAIRGVGEQSDGNSFVLIYVISDEVESHKSRVFLIICSSVIFFGVAVLLFLFRKQKVAIKIQWFVESSLFVKAAAIVIIAVGYKLVEIIAIFFNCGALFSELAGISIILISYCIISSLLAIFGSIILSDDYKYSNYRITIFIIMASLLVVLSSIVFRITTAFFGHSSVISNTAENTTSFLSYSTLFATAFEVPMAVICYQIVEIISTMTGFSSYSSVLCVIPLVTLSFEVVVNTAAFLGCNSYLFIVVEIIKTFIRDSWLLSKNDVIIISNSSSLFIALTVSLWYHFYHSTRHWLLRHSGQEVEKEKLVEHPKGKGPHSGSSVSPPSHFVERPGGNGLH